MANTSTNPSRPLIWSAAPTPFLADGTLDEAGLERMVEQHLRLGVSGLFLAGTCGEGPFMPDERRTDLVRAVCKLASGRLHVSVQVSDTSAARVIENMQRLTDAGAESVVIAPPFVVGEALCSAAFLRRYFLEPIERATGPVGVYVRPPVGKAVVPLDVWDEIAGHERVTFVKDSSSSAEYVRHFVELRRRRPGLVLMTGDEWDVISAVAGGYDGCLMGTAILNARLIARALEALAAGDRAAAQTWQRRSNALLVDLFRADASAWMGGLKYALCRAGIFTTEFSHLAYPLSEDDRRRIDAALAREREFV